jgi:hypothetical protein
MVQALGSAAATSGEAAAPPAEGSDTADLDALVAERLEAAHRGELGPAHPGPAHPGPAHAGADSGANGAPEAETADAESRGEPSAGA